ncbi:SANT/Myb_domain [Hexamita inflata]|uniref:SANT/Myb domain n=1 Tax=Hexamita inflata TaxID=28002 RepID=A0AA86THE4_9EUKA|nr:SANT/Myb domain [Hexamita inflata]CAI9917772.1 SANT/Myb domain [Hexamita inflata]CAI9918603.1 SANT/Myb domain [Hexamita inflata]CAI9918609.1 SANT/Myb domain [Hexamita inflata]CAI9944983.1 SANT/Myb domain [Hexamita inflata]
MKFGQPWSEEEMNVFRDLIKKYHNDFRQIADEMNRSYSQIRSQYYNLHRKPTVRPKKQDKKQNKSLTSNDDKSQTQSKTKEQKTNSNTSQQSSENKSSDNKEQHVPKNKQTGKDDMSFIIFDDID